jgi:hypothetical protein
MRSESDRERGRGPTAAGAWRSLALLVLLWLPTSAALAAEPSVITLRDGTTITGEVVSMVGGLYSIQSATLGSLTVRESDIRSITKGATSPPAAAAGVPSQLDGLQERMAADPETMKAVSALQDSPEIKALLEDPEVMEALRSGNLEVLLANPKLARLAADPRIQEITRKFAQ